MAEAGERPSVGEHGEGRPLAVLLSMLSLVPGGMGGSETYAKRLAIGLDTRADVTVGVLVPGNAVGFTRVAGEFAEHRVTARPSTVGRLWAIVRAAVPSRRTRAQVRASEVVHFPFTVPVPRPRRRAVVMTVHDVQHRDLPGLFSWPERMFRVFAYEVPARRADVVITVSEFARKGIERHLRVDRARIRVIPLGVDTSVFRPNLGAREPFLLYPARGWAHKNHAKLIEAVGMLRESRPDLRLVLTGGNLASLGDVPEWVEVRGLVPTVELHDLYRRAAALVFPSLYEGFGLPPLEAMASGCPVAASNVGSIPEVCGDAAVLFDPADPADIARGAREALERSEELAALGLERAGLFSWDACIEGHVAAYRDAAATRGRRG